VERDLAMKSFIVSMFAAAIMMLAVSVFATDMPGIAKKNQCTACHTIDKKLVGPSFMDVSKFYNGKTERTTSGKTLTEATGGKVPEEWLLGKVSHGGSGNWGSAAMMPNDPTGKKQDEIKALIEFVLGLAK